MIRDDPEIGLVRLCKGCLEEWPFDDEFFHMKDDDLSPAWPRRCRACCLEMRAGWRRSRMEVLRVERVVPQPIEGRCNALMRGGRCGRTSGHDYKHRTTVAMATESARTRSARAAGIRSAAALH